MICYWVFYCDQDERTTLTPKKYKYRINGFKQQKSIANTLLTFTEAMEFSPVSVTFDEFTKHFLIVEAMEITDDRYIITNIPTEQEALFNEFDINKTINL